jgi:hypothetical protein
LSLLYSSSISAEYGRRPVCPQRPPQQRSSPIFLKDQAEPKGEVGKLDFDPLYAAQDFEIKDFSVVLVAQQKDSAEVAASFKNMGTSKKIAFLLANTAEGWRITDIKYSDGRTLKGILK